MHIEFHDSEGPSLGIEVELELVDLASRDLASHASEILEVLGAPYGPTGHPKAKHELFECTIEVITGICATPAEARADLSETIALVRQQADARGLGLLCSGTHPFSHWADQVISPNPRYAALVERMGWMARRLQIFGVHYHVGVRSAEKAVAIANALSAYIPHFLALSASSPFWHGHDTGLASCRSKVFEGLPTAGLPEPIRDWEDFEHFMGTLVSANAISTVREVWWDVRPHPDFGTVELRMCDGIPNLDDVIALGALSQCLVEHLSERYDEGVLPVPERWVIRQNKWRAARYGLEAAVIIDDEGSSQPVTAAIGELVSAVAPMASRLGCKDELDGVQAIIDRGGSYLRQRAILAAGGELADVVDALVAELDPR